MKVPAHRWLLAALLVGLGSLQALDSGIGRTTPLPALLVALGILAPALAILAGGRRARLAALVGGVAILLAAQVLSLTPLPDLVLIGALGYAVFLCAERFDGRRAGDGAAVGC